MSLRDSDLVRARQSNQFVRFLPAQAGLRR
jgi:hypothetical protein